MAQATARYPNVPYRYEVAWQTYTSKTYSYKDFLLENERLLWRKLPDRSPGRTVTVYYDPADPSQSVLSRIVYSSDWYVIFFFLSCASFLGVAAEVVRLYRDDMSRGATNVLNSGWIPGWGRCRFRNGCCTINSQGRAFFVAASVCIIPYWAAWGWFMFGSRGESLGYVDPLNILLVAAGIAAVGLAAGFGWQLAHRPSVLTVDTTHQRMSLKTSRRHLGLPLDGIRFWALQKVLHPEGPVNSTPALTPLLSVRTSDGESEPIHLFTTDSGRSAAERVAGELAALTGKKVNQLPDEDVGGPVQDDEKSRLHRLYAQRARATRRRRQLADVR